MQIVGFLMTRLNLCIFLEVLYYCVYIGWAPALSMYPKSTWSVGPKCPVYKSHLPQICDFCNSLKYCISFYAKVMDKTHKIHSYLLNLPIPILKQANLDHEKSTQPNLIRNPTLGPISIRNNKDNSCRYGIYTSGFNDDMCYIVYHLNNDDCYIDDNDIYTFTYTRLDSCMFLS